MHIHMAFQKKSVVVNIQLNFYLPVPILMPEDSLADELLYWTLF